MTPDVEKSIATINVWYQVERACIVKAKRRPRLMLGAVIWGQWYLDVFATYGLPSILAPENVAALQDACITIYTNAASRERLDAILQPARDAGIEVELLEIPDEVLAASDRPFLALAAAQQLLVTRAARGKMAFHQLAPDHGYSNRYFPNLKRLGKLHGNVAHGGLNVDRPPLPDLEAYRKGGALVVPARDLATIGWDHTVMCTMNGTTPEKMPDEHYQVWRARDRVMLFNVYANPAYMPAEVCSLLDTENMTTGTLDCHTKSLFRSAFYAPQAGDDMAFVSIDRNTQPAANYTTMDKFLARCWAEISGQSDLMFYYLRATEMAASIDKRAPTAEAVMGEQAKLMRMVVERAKVVA